MVRAKLDGLLRERVFFVPERTVTETVLEPHQRRNDRYELGH